MAEAAQKLAKAKYAAKVCGYLGIDKSKCETVFDKLLKNMKSTFEAIA